MRKSIRLYFMIPSPVFFRAGRAQSDAFPDIHWVSLLQLDGLNSENQSGIFCSDGVWRIKEMEPYGLKIITIVIILHGLNDIASSLKTWSRRTWWYGENLMMTGWGYVWWKCLDIIHNYHLYSHYTKSKRKKYIRFTFVFYLFANQNVKTVNLLRSNSIKVMFWT